MMASLDSDPNKAKEVMKGFYFFLFQLSEVIKPKDLEPYGVTEDQLAPMKAAWKKGDMAVAKAHVPNEAVDALTLTGIKETVQRRLDEYLLAGVDLPIIMPIGNVDSQSPIWHRQILFSIKASLSRLNIPQNTLNLK